MTDHIEFDTLAGQIYDEAIKPVVDAGFPFGIYGRVYYHKSEYATIAMLLRYVAKNDVVVKIQFNDAEFSPTSVVTSDYTLNKENKDGNTIHEIEVMHAEYGFTHTIAQEAKGTVVSDEILLNLQKTSLGVVVKVDSNGWSSRSEYVLKPYVPVSKATKKIENPPQKQQ